MYNEVQIKEILDSKLEIVKQAHNKKPEFSEIYCRSVDFFERISVHSEIGKYPEKLLSNRAPNQTQQEADYIKATYKTTTLPIWTKYNGSISGIWNPQNWSIKWNQENNPISTVKETPQNYLDTEYPVFGSLESYYKSVVTNTKQKDANGVIVHKPYFIPAKLNDGGELIVDSSERISPIAVIYNSPQVWDYLDEEYVLIELKEKSWVKSGNSTKEKTGYVFEFYDQYNIWRIVQTGDKKDWKFDILIYWPHNLGYLPADKLKGDPIITEDGVLYQSKFMGAVEIMDDILLDDTYLRITKAGHAFQHKWEYVDECDYSNDNGSCINGHVMLDTGSGMKEHTCPKCHGAGVAKTSSPLGVTQVRMPNQRGTGGADGITIPPFGWGAPNPEIMEFLRKEIDINTEKSYSLLNLVSSSDVKGTETALGKMIDRQEKESFVQPIIHETFELFGFSIKCINDMRYGLGVVEMPAIQQPKTSAIKSEADLTAEIATAKEQGLPDIALRNLLLEYLNTRFQTDERVNKSIDLTFHIDRLVSLSSTEIVQKKASGTVAGWEDILHTSVYIFIADALVKDPKFFDKPIENQGKVIIAMAKAKDLELNPSKLDPDKIMLNGVPGAVDAEAEAAARLRGSVGGAQVITGFVEKVSSGEMNRDAAIEGLKFLFKVDDVQASALLGPIKEQKPNGI